MSEWSDEEILEVYRREFMRLDEHRSLEHKTTEDVVLATVRAVLDEGSIRFAKHPKCTEFCQRLPQKWLPNER